MRGAGGGVVDERVMGGGVLIDARWLRVRTGIVSGCESESESGSGSEWEKVYGSMGGCCVVEKKERF